MVCAWSRQTFVAILAVFLVFNAVRAEFPLMAGFAEVDISPDVGGKKPVWLAGYGFGRKANGVHDPLMVRCVVFQHGRRKLALVSVDLVGLQYPAVKRIREKLAGFDYVLVSSTHNHEGPDVVGIWGMTPLHRGVDDNYLQMVVDRTAQAVKNANRDLRPVTASYGTAKDESLLNDSRQPIVFDGVLRAVRLNHAEDGKVAGVIVQWNSHPEALGSRNKKITADFPHATVAALKNRYNCPVVYFSGAVGGLMAPPRGRIKDSEGNQLGAGNFEYARLYGEEVAKLAARALDSAKPIGLTPFQISARPIFVPVENIFYRTAKSTSVLVRDAFEWTGDFQKAGRAMRLTDVLRKTMAVETEVAYLRLGELHVAGIPGEIYPELVYGTYQDPPDPGADFPDAPLEKPVVEILPGKNWMLLGLANDEIGYIIPRRQWDAKRPFAYGRKKAQYGEINSCGPAVAPIMMQALERCVRALDGE